MKGRELRALLVVRDGPCCFWCGRITFDPLEVGDTADAAATVDHLDTPKPRRSVRDPSRAVLACSRCNRDRGCLTVEEWSAVLEVRGMARSRPSGEFGFCVVLVVAVLWWAPTIVAALAEVGLFHLGTYRLVLRGRRLRLAGRLDEALTTLEQAKARVAGRRRPVGRL